MSLQYETHAIQMSIVTGRMSPAFTPPGCATSVLCLQADLRNAAFLVFRLPCHLINGQMVVFLDRDEFKSTWLGNKSIYRTRMAIADGGELIVMAPGVTKFGEDPGIDALIRRVRFSVRLFARGIVCFSGLPCMPGRLWHRRSYCSTDKALLLLVGGGVSTSWHRDSRGPTVVTRRVLLKALNCTKLNQFAVRIIRTPTWVFCVCFPSVEANDGLRCRLCVLLDR